MNGLFTNRGRATLATLTGATLTTRPTFATFATLPTFTARAARATFAVRWFVGLVFFKRHAAIAVGIDLLVNLLGFDRVFFAHWTGLEFVKSHGTIGIGVKLLEDFFRGWAHASLAIAFAFAGALGLVLGKRERRCNCQRAECADSSFHLCFVCLGESLDRYSESATAYSTTARHVGCTKLCKFPVKQNGRVSRGTRGR